MRYVTQSLTEQTIFIDPAREIEIREDLLREVQAETSISNSPAPVSRITEPLTDLHSRV